MSDETAPVPLEYVVVATDAGERFDKLVARVAGVSRQRAMTLLAEGHVRIGRRPPKKGERAEPGATLTIAVPASETPVPQPDLPLSVIHEDAFLLALDKPAGVSMHPLLPAETGTLANAVVARYPDVLGASPEDRCPGLVHRLDRETSGVVLWARTRATFDHLRAQFAAKTVVKRYYALVDGFVEGAGELDVPLAHAPKNAARMVATPYPADAEAMKARPALTRYKALGLGDGATLVEVEIPTGVMHQIRAHFSFVGYPVMGDTLYGAKARDGLARHVLHAASITVSHPDGSGEHTYTSPLPDDFRAACASVGITPP
jgi:23S rRNA pseudouridine1911/1915/1917 synthase